MSVIRSAAIWSLWVISTDAISMPKLSKSPLLGSDPAQNLPLIWADSLDEITEPLELRDIQGKLPKYLEGGTLLRNGPALFGAIQDGSDTVKHRYSHAFDGLAKLQRYQFFENVSGKTAVKFSTKFLRSKVYDRVVTQKKDISAGLSLGGIVPKYSTLKTLKGLLFDSPDNIGVNVHKLGGLEKDGPWVATTDSPILMGFDPVTLETEGLVKSPDLIASKGGIPLFSTAHPKAQGGYTYNYFLELRPIPFLHNGNLAHIVRIDPSLRQKIVGTVNLGKDVVPYVHDISITDRYAILIIWPLFFDLSKMLDSKGLFPNMNYKPDITSKIYVFDISKCVDGEEGVNSSVEPVARFESDPLVAYHHINAFEEAGNVVVDVTAYRKPDIITGEHGFSYPDQLKDPALRVKQERLGNCFRWTLPVDQVKGTSEFVRVAPLELKAFDEAGLDYSYELVRISPLTGGRRHRYSYGYSSWAGTGPDRGAYLEWGIVKLDHQAAEARAQSMQGVEEKGKKEGPSTAQIWRAPSCFPGEPVFVPDPGAETGNEDAGALVSIVFDAARKESFLLVLDAHTMEELARCYIGMPLPYSFHGEIYFDPK